MDHSQIEELHKIIEDHCLSKGYEAREVLAFLSACFVGTMESQGYSQEFMDATADRMKENFKMLRQLSKEEK